MPMIDAARSLDPKERKPDDPLPPSVHLLAESIDHFARRNVGIRAILELYRAGRHVEAAVIHWPISPEPELVARVEADPAVTASRVLSR
jgi:hypothetical protein